MNRLFRKTAAILTAAVMTVSSLGTDVFAAGAKTPSQTTVIAFEASVAKPKVAIKGSPGVRKARLSTTTAGATIYYTTNGTTPTAKSKKYREGSFIRFSSSKTLKAIAIKGSAKSAVMTKKINIDTVCGDVNGDGKINQSDYTRLRNYFNKKTEFICKDNADTNGSGGLSSKDLEVLSLYLNGTVKSLPYKKSTSLKTPLITVYNSLGCKKVEFTSSQSGVTFYYTTDGSTPSINSRKYSGRVPIYDDTTVKVIAYKDGLTSSVKSVDVKVEQCLPVISTTATATTYNNSVQVKLACNTDKSKIYYTTDGSDPRTSATAALYSNPFTLSKTATVRAYSQAKGFTDSNVSTFTFNVTENSGYEISGYVWNDTPSVGVTANGVRATNEGGIAGITVNLIDPRTNAVVTTKLTGADGGYSFTNLSVGNAYKVEFKYNYLKYRAFQTVIPGGNQAVPTLKTIPTFTIKNGGIYDETEEKYILESNNYKTATESSLFLTSAVTVAEYTQTTANVNLALITNISGGLDLSITSTGQNSSNMVSNGSNLTYNIKLTNSAPAESLSHVVIEVFLINSFSDISIIPPLNNSTLSQKWMGTKDGYNHYTITGLLANELKAGESITFGISTTVNTGTGSKLQCFAEVSEYRYKNSSLDAYSIPGNFVLGNVKEKDEAASSVVTVSEEPAARSNEKTISIDKTNLTLVQGQQLDKAFQVFVVNGTASNDVIIENKSDNISYTVTESRAGSVYVYTFNLKATTPGTGKITVYLRTNTSKNVSINIKVVLPSPTM